MTTPSTPMIRGYAIIQTARYIETQFPPDQARRGMAALPPAIREAIPTWKPGEWYPREATIALYRAIAAIRGDEAGVYDDLVRCGEFIASEATNTFLRLVMRIMARSCSPTRSPTSSAATTAPAASRPTPRGPAPPWSGCGSATSPASITTASSRSGGSSSA
jgi:hypothetical protein